MEARAFAPGHISTFFAPRGDPDRPLKYGSVGSGFSIAEGVTTAVEVDFAARSARPRHAVREGPTAPARRTRWWSVVDNGVPARRVDTTLGMKRYLEAEAVRRHGASALPTRVTFRNEYRLPLGAGFGVSGAVALAGALAYNEAAGFGLPRSACVQAAHCGEVKALTGLGDVAAQAVGGVEVREREGPPPAGRVRRVPSAAEPIVLASFGPRPTRAFLRDAARKDALEAAGTRALAAILARPSLRASTRLGRRFADELGLVSPRAGRLMEALGPKVPSSVAMLGDSVFALGGAAVEARVRRAVGGAFVASTRVALRGARLL
jgi:pantoate kinase